VTTAKRASKATPKNVPPLSGLSDYARDARKMALAPYSNFKVGAALLTVDGEIITGCNVESATYGLTLCAERIAVFKAVSEGFKKFSAIAVVADSHIVTPPCGACRQVLWELCGNIWVHIADLKGHKNTMRLETLLPKPFDKRFL
jgi:cytidine deaminase